MHLDRLRGFAAVARWRNFTRAAEALHLSQPSLSRQIAALEAELGVELFHRSRGRVETTQAGRALLPIAARMLADAETARRTVREIAGLQRGRVRLGAPPTLCVSLVAEALRVFRAERPGIEVQITERGSRELLERLDEGGLDLALVVSPTAHGGGLPVSIERAPLLSEQLVVVSSAEGPAPGEDGAVALEELAELPQLFFHRDYDLRATAEAAFARAGLSPRVVVEGAEMDAVLRFAECGIGVALVPATVLVDRPALRATRLRAPRLHRTVGIARRGDASPEPAVRAMLEVLLGTARELTRPGGPLVGLARPARGLRAGTPQPRS